MLFRSSVKPVSDVVRFRSSDLNCHSAPQIALYNSDYSSILCPLANFKVLPENLFAIPLPNGDISLRYSDGQEAFFDVVGVIVATNLVAPVGLAKCVLLSPLARFSDLLTFLQGQISLLSTMGQNHRRGRPLLR